MYSIVSHIIMMLLIAGTCSGQYLERKGSLGAVIYNTLDTNGILLGRIIPGSTAESLGLQEGDIVYSINGKTYNQTARLVALTRNWRAGDAVEFNLVRQGETIQLIGTVKGKPVEKYKNGTVEYGSVQVKDGRLRTLLCVPKGIRHPPVVYYIQGFGCGSIDYYATPNDPVRQLCQGLLDAGIAFFRMEQYGQGDSQGKVDCASIGYHQEVNAFYEGLKYLKSQSNIDSAYVFLFGHSLGGITSALLASRESIKGIINYGSVSTTWYEYLMRVLREQEELRGTDYRTIEKEVRTRGPILFDYLINKLTPQGLMAKPAYREHLASGLPMMDGNLMIGRHYTFMQEINDVNLAQALKDAHTYLLAIHGEFDIHAIDPDWAEDQANMVNYHYPGHGTWLTLPKTEHGFAIVPSMEEHVNMRDSNQITLEYLSKHYNPDLHHIVVDWIKARLSSRPDPE